MNTEITNIELPEDRAWVFNSFAHAYIPPTSRVLKKIRGSREGKCARAFFAVQEAIKCR